MNRSLRIAAAAVCVIVNFGFGQKSFGYSTTLFNAFLQWADGQNVQVVTEGLLETPSYVRNDSSPAEIGWSDTLGRVRLVNTGPYSPTASFEVFYMNINSHTALLPSQLNDQSLVVGTPIGTFGGWGLAVAFGAGYAGNSPYNDPSAIYGLGQITASDTLSVEDSLYVSVSYNGNREFLPDVPLPTVEYVHLGDSLQWALGVAFESLRWQATKQLQISAEYDPLNEGFADVDYATLQWLHVYTRFETDSRAFHLSNYNANQRLFVSMNRVEGGFRIHALKDHLSVQLAGGYAFDQEFGQGYDSRDEHDFAQIANAPYADVQLQFNF